MVTSPHFANPALAPSHAASPMSTFANLRDWCCERGAEWSPTLEVRDGERGRGVFATAPIKEGELLLRLPASLIIQPSGPIAKLVANGECSKLLGLALTHMHESRVAEPRAPYFADLASQPPPNVPLRWREARTERMHRARITSSGEGGGVDGVRGCRPSAHATCCHDPRQADVAQLLGTSLLPRGCSAADAEAAAEAHFKEAVLPAMRAAGEAWLPAALHERGAFEVPLASPLASRAASTRCVMRRRPAQASHTRRTAHLAPGRYGGDMGEIRTHAAPLISHLVTRCRCPSRGSSRARSSGASRTSTAPPASGRTWAPTRPPPSRATATASSCCPSST